MQTVQILDHQALDTDHQALQRVYHYQYSQAVYFKNQLALMPAQFSNWDAWFEPVFVSSFDKQNLLSPGYEAGFYNAHALHKYGLNIGSWLCLTKSLIGLAEFIENYRYLENKNALNPVVFKVGEKSITFEKSDLPNILGFKLFNPPPSSGQGLINWALHAFEHNNYLADGLIVRKNQDNVFELSLRAPTVVEPEKKFELIVEGKSYYTAYSPVIINKKSAAQLEKTHIKIQLLLAPISITSWLLKSGVKQIAISIQKLYWEKTVGKRT